MYFPPKRFQLFEFHDSSWFPSLIRDYITDVLQALWITDFLFITAPYKVYILIFFFRRLTSLKQFFFSRKQQKLFLML
jgi:hypothetical protein